MKINHKNIILLVLALLCGVFAYVAFKPEDKFYDKELLQKQYNSLNRKYDSLGKEFKALGVERVILKNERDSLKKLPEKIKIQYVIKYKEIDKMGSSALSSEFEELFTDNNVK